MTQKTVHDLLEVIFVCIIIACVIGFIVDRFQHAELTETQLFIRQSPVFGILILCVVVFTIIEIFLDDRTKLH